MDANLVLVTAVSQRESAPEVRAPVENWGGEGVGEALRIFNRFVELR